MVVMPAFAMAYKTEENIVSGIVGRFIILGTENVANGVDRPRDMMGNANPC